MQTTIYCRDDQLEVDIEVEYDATYQPAKISGRPEDCYPDESEMKLTSFTVTGWRDLSDEEALAPPTKQELKAAFDAAADRLTTECWEDFHRG